MEKVQPFMKKNSEMLAYISTENTVLFQFYKKTKNHNYIITFRWPLSSRGEGGGVSR